MAGALPAAEGGFGPTAGRLDRVRALLLSPALLAIFVFMVLPLGFVVVYSFLTPGTYGGVVWEFSTEA